VELRRFSKDAFPLIWSTTVLTFFVQYILGLLLQREQYQCMLQHSSIILTSTRCLPCLLCTTMQHLLDPLVWCQFQWQRVLPTSSCFDMIPLQREHSFIHLRLPSSSSSWQMIYTSSQTSPFFIHQTPALSAVLRLLVSPSTSIFCLFRLQPISANQNTAAFDILLRHKHQVSMDQTPTPSLPFSRRPRLKFGIAQLPSFSQAVLLASISLLLYWSCHSSLPVANTHLSDDTNVDHIKSMSVIATCNRHILLSPPPILQSINDVARAIRPLFMPMTLYPELQREYYKRPPSHINQPLLCSYRRFAMCGRRAHLPRPPPLPDPASTVTHLPATIVPEGVPMTIPTATTPPCIIHLLQSLHSFFEFWYPFRANSVFFFEFWCLFRVTIPICASFVHRTKYLSHLNERECGSCENVKSATEEVLLFYMCVKSIMTRLKPVSCGFQSRNYECV
jgi:hypothetical protein